MDEFNRRSGARLYWYHLAMCASKGRIDRSWNHRQCQDFMEKLFKKK